MAFFENIGKKLTDASQGVAAQTKNFVEVTRLNGVISEDEKKIEGLFAELGKAYYERHKEDPAAEELQNIEAVKELYDHIAQCREQIKQIKGIIKCPNCGADVPDEAQFCNVCGTKLEKEEQRKEEQEPVCPKCGVPVTEDMEFCTACGAKLSAEEETAPEAEDAKEPVCPNCHKTVTQEAAYCPSCGARLHG